MIRLCLSGILFFFFLSFLFKMITDINNIPIDEALKSNGYVIVDNLIPQEMFTSLREACDRVVEKARKGEWKHRY